MKGTKIQDVVYDLVLPVVEKKNLELVAVEYVKEGGNWYLRIYIDKEGGVDLEDCQNVSHAVSVLMDEKDPIPQAYFLEVSSPGVERVLQTDKDLARFHGRMAAVHLYTPIEGQKTLQGSLGNFDSENLEIIQQDKTWLIPRKKIAQVRLAWEE